MASEPVLQSIITCPQCGHRAEETMPTNACLFFYDCPACGAKLKPKAGDCCVFCSYGSVPCPPIQTGSRRCSWNSPPKPYKGDYRFTRFSGVGPTTAQGPASGACAPHPARLRGDRLYGACLLPSANATCRRRLAARAWVNRHLQP